MIKKLLLGYPMSFFILLILAYGVLSSSIHLFYPKYPFIISDEIPNPNEIFINIGEVLISLAAMIVTVFSVNIRRANIYDILIGFLYPILFASFSIMNFAIKFRDCGLLPKADYTAGDYLYFSIVTWTTLGYGDIVPSKACRSYASIEALTGYFVSALIIATIVSVAQRLSWYNTTENR